MRYTVEGFNQRVLTEDLKLNHGDALILRWCVDFYFSGRMTIWNNPADGKDYFYVSYQAIIDDWPCLEINNSEVIRRRFKKFVDCGLMESCIRNKGGRFPYYRLTSKYYDLVSEPSESQKGTMPKKLPQAIDPPPENENGEEKKDIHSTQKSSEATQKSSEATQKSSWPTQKSSWPTQKSGQRSINYNQSITSINYDPSTTSSVDDTQDEPSAKHNSDDDVDEINSIFSSAKRNERITVETLRVIREIHDTTNEEIKKAVKAVIAQANENARTGADPIRNIIGMLKGRKNGDGRYHSYCFSGGVCILAEADATPESTAHTPQGSTFGLHDTIFQLPQEMVGDVLKDSGQSKEQFLATYSAEWGSIAKERLHDLLQGIG